MNMSINSYASKFQALLCISYIKLLLSIIYIKFLLSIVFFSFFFFFSFLCISYKKFVFIYYFCFYYFFFQTKSQYSSVSMHQLHQVSFIHQLHKVLLSIIFVLSDKISKFIPLINGKNQRYKH